MSIRFQQYQPVQGEYVEAELVSVMGYMTDPDLSVADKMGVRFHIDIGGVTFDGIMPLESRADVADLIEALQRASASIYPPEKPR